MHSRVMDQDERVALVTGASSGIGKATARAFERDGYTAVTADLAECQDGHFIRCDVSDEDSIRHLIAETVAKFGRIDAAFNNAGILGDLGPTADCTSANFDRVIAVNLRGVFLCMREELKQMVQQPGGGAIVNCSSVAGLVGLAGAPAYVASKHGVAGVTKTAALEYAKSNIRVNAVCPGPIDTPMLDKLIAGIPNGRDTLLQAEPVGRFASPDEIASVVVWLCSPQASFVTGIAMAADGGWTVG
jgi:NAD(P)-dependent dehydrogenase (short-subunit alcohol dehydrogenase family)